MAHVPRGRGARSKGAVRYQRQHVRRSCFSCTLYVCGRSKTPSHSEARRVHSVRGHAANTQGFLLERYLGFGITALGSIPATCLYMTSYEVRISQPAFLASCWNASAKWDNRKGRHAGRSSGKRRTWRQASPPISSLVRAWATQGCKEGPEQNLCMIYSSKSWG